MDVKENRTPRMKRRWYDQDPACPRILNQIQGIPQPEVREFCARLMVNLCEKLRKEIQHREKDTSNISSLGMSALTARYWYGQNKRRWYDSELVLHKAIGMLYSMPQIGLSVIGYMLKDAVELVEIYAVVCQQVEQPPNMAELSRIATTALKSGRQEAEAILIGLVGKDLYRAIYSSLQARISNHQP